MGSAELNTHRAHPARVYDYLLGGKDNFQADRDMAMRLMEDAPSMAVAARANRAFMTRTARYLAAERGIRQFLDVGTGLPTSPNLHEVAQGVAPESRVVYVDNDPIVLVHARALLTSTPEGRTAYIDADLSDPEAILGSPQFTSTLDLSQPVAVCLFAILHFVTDDSEARQILDTLLGPLVPGSALAISVATAASSPQEMNRAMTLAAKRGILFKTRGKAEVEGLLSGLDLVEPGVVLVNHWHPNDEDRATADTDVYTLGAVAIKP